MRREPVDSSVLASVGYDPDCHILEIEFRSGSVYAYDDVTPGLHLRLMTAPSIGSFFDAEIRDIKPFRRVR
ncbi:KTSC domain-containing protein [Bacillus sp. NP157]|nr:KTSC domain-containing protein [Bacillus sp. NP157]